MNKRLISILLLASLVTPIWAQKLRPANLERALAKPASVPMLSKRTNARAYMRLKQIFNPLPISQVQPTLPHFTPVQNRQVFQVQQGRVSHSTASAFALEIEGNIWGVTAGHVMKNISQDPYVKVQNHLGKPIFAPIEKFYTASIRQSDVAIFEIPAHVRPYIDILQPASQLPAAQTSTQSPCFVQGNPLYLPAEDILFAGPHRLLLRDQTHREMTGYCGSPVLVDEKVVGVHVGAYSSQDVQLTDWAALLREVSASAPPSLHVASPIAHAVLLARGIKDPNLGIPLKVFGHTVALLPPRDQLYSIQLLRNGYLQQTLHQHPFVDFEKLEEFFELQEGDVLRITILSPKSILTPKSIQMLDVSIPSGQVTYPLQSQP